ncbi:hypothetical protein NUK31_08435 [Aeromonas caviae]|uniref:DUF7940 domain-containing protein n=1 Tax=Aeromonas caviae TaxID=648 RepID=UPI00214EAC80|nr:hypothetical protein [Aeromonas caviae]MCR3893088.1 hypothetical protein [Aeromonas caviae]
MQIISDWKLAYKFSSMQLMAFATACDLIVVAMAIINEQFPFSPQWYVGLRLLMTMGSMLARLIAQPQLAQQSSVQPRSA